MNQTMPKQLPIFRGYTVDFRLREFRRVDLRLLSIDFIPFDSAEGLQLLKEMYASEESSRKRMKIQSHPDYRGPLRCLCGNTPAQQGFYPCSSEGQQVEPTPEDWNTNCYVCDRCGRIIDQTTLAVVGVRFDNTLTLGERQEIFARGPFLADLVDEIAGAGKRLSKAEQELEA